MLNNTLLRGFLIGCLITIVLLAVWFYWAWCILRWSESRMKNKIAVKYSAQNAAKLQPDSRFITLNMQPAIDLNSLLADKSTVESIWLTTRYYIHTGLKIPCVPYTHVTADIYQLNFKTKEAKKQDVIHYNITDDCKIFQTDCIAL